MWLSEPLPFIESLIEELGQGLQAHDPNLKLTATQRGAWPICHTPGVQLALPNSYFDSIGLPRLSR
jgi:hypothetical protein